MRTLPTDPLFNAQWYLRNTGQRGEAGIDINVTPVWADYTGRGVTVAVNDDGMDLTHPDLEANILTALVFDTASGTTGRGFANASNSHGTVVGSIIAMGNNGVGGVGVAYDAKLVPSLAVGANIEASSLFLANLASGVAVSCNSWGSDPAFAENFSANVSPSDQAWGLAMLRCVTEARGGLGMVIEVSGGNERGNNADTALSNFTSARYTIAVGALDHTGKVTDYSTAGASLLVSAPGGVGASAQSVNTGYGIASADVSGAQGYNATAGAAGDYAYQNQGTSYSGPMVAAVAALMLQANPQLGFRDVSNILAMTARQVDTSSSSWVATGGSSWNLGGMHFSRDHGFGLLDAKAAVHLAESWSGVAATVTNWQTAEALATAAPAIVPENQQALAITTAMAQNVLIERVEVLLELDASAPSQLRATLTSPSGTTVTLFDRPLTRPLKDGAPDMTVAETAWPGVFTIGATAFLGENSTGTWKLTLEDMVDGAAATYKSMTVKAWGSALTANDNLVLTDEFKGARLLADTDGIDTLNGAALSSAVTINLNSGAKSTVAGGEITIASGTVIENVFSGDGSDTLVGNAANNIFRGNRGDDAIDGGLGIDTAIYAGPSAQYVLSPTATGYLVNTTAGFDGQDTLVAIERLQFENSRIALDVAGNAGTVAKILGAVFGASAVSNKAYVGIGLGYLDSGMSYADLMQLAIDVRLGGRGNSTDVVTLLYTNVVGSAPDAESLAFYKDYLDSGSFTQGTLGVLAADTSLNTARINLVGLAQTGLEYTI